VNGGDTYWHTDPSDDPHLWIVLSEPKMNAEQVLLVNVTSYAAYKETCCELNVGDHQSIKHRSVVYYQGAKCETMLELGALKSKSWIRMDVPLAPSVLERVRKGAAESKRMKLDYGEILMDQGLI
jgi:hypothetical protein